MFFTYDPKLRAFDLSFDVKNWISSAVISSLFTYKTKSPSWWAEELSTPIGSTLHRLKREKLSEEVLELSQELSEEALKWLVEKVITSDIKITTYPKGDSLILDVELHGIHEPQMIQRTIKNVFQLPHT